MFFSVWQSLSLFWASHSTRNDLEAPVLLDKHVKWTSRRTSPYPPCHGTSPLDALDAACMVVEASNTPAAPMEGTADHDPVKKRRHYEQDHSNPSEENGDNTNHAPLSVVFYKKRGTGAPVVFRPTIEGGSLWKVNHNIVASTVETSAQEKVLNHQLNKDRTLVVTVSTPLATNNLFTVTELAGVAVGARIQCLYMAIYGKNGSIFTG
ncbi:hypothetical protein HPB51_000011 [Rhipicephalus microplus]|uniref:Uncharacterized protein n=1 Tax=Rhipicephalus microplus TaxID=6941 RepID=A0A9J6DRL7_RHIMP|nr:hypothetical protein HPB51_000011 [Rhipicephalus microplus]